MNPIAFDRRSFIRTAAVAGAAGVLAANASAAFAD